VPENGPDPSGHQDLTDLTLNLYYAVTLIAENQILGRTGYMIKEEEDRYEYRSI
jgi:hypothetical protein